MDMELRRIGEHGTTRYPLSGQPHGLAWLDFELKHYSLVVAFSASQVGSTGDWVAPSLPRLPRTQLEVAVMQFLGSHHKICTSVSLSMAAPIPDLETQQLDQVDVARRTALLISPERESCQETSVSEIDTSDTTLPRWYISFLQKKSKRETNKLSYSSTVISNYSDLALAHIGYLESRLEAENDITRLERSLSTPENEEDTMERIGKLLGDYGVCVSHFPFYCLFWLPTRIPTLLYLEANLFAETAVSKYSTWVTDRDPTYGHSSHRDLQKSTVVLSGQSVRGYTFAQRTRRLLMAALGALIFLVPMLIMVLHPTILTSLLTVITCTLAFAVPVTLFFEEAREVEIMAGVAAYASVLIGFVQVYPGNGGISDQ